MATKRYNGHRCYGWWNQALWIANDEGLYRFALDCAAAAKGQPRPFTTAAERFIDHLRQCGHPTTGDGVPWNVPAVATAIKGLLD